MEITNEVVQHIASLARLEIQDSEVAEYQSHLQKVLNHMKELESINTDDVEPLFSPVFDKQEELSTQREDKIEESMTAEQVIANAPKHKQNQFLVEAVIDEN